ncbi:MAG: 50S ribosomal protein L1 [Thaumarchaeota archaeon]|nr:MAG: 50S ribosomal protein L1 [Nitrososphaerota archaeon]
MLSSQQLTDLIKKGKGEAKERKFNEAVEVILTLREVDAKKADLNVNETVYLPHPTSKVARICFIGAGDMALRAKNAKVDAVIDPSRLESLAGDKKEAKKVARSYDFFLADTALMPRIGKILGQSLGPRGKIPIPVPPNAPIEAMIQRMRTAIRVRSRGSLGIAAKVGERKLSDSELAENVLAVVQAVEKKLPQGEKNIKSVIVKTSMGKPVKQAVGQS